METLYYSRTRLVFGFLFFGAVTLLLGYLLLHRELTEHLHGRGAIISGSFGHFFTLPLFFFSTLFFTYRLAVTAADAKAIECTAQHLVISSPWRRREIAWAQVGPIEIVHRRVKNKTTHTLVIHRLEDGQVKGRVNLLLGAVTLDPARWQDYAEALAATSVRMGGRAFGPSPDFPNAVQPENAVGGFDPDVALARYRTSRAVEVPEPVVSPARPAFGRKGR